MCFVLAFYTLFLTTFVDNVSLSLLHFVTICVLQIVAGIAMLLHQERSLKLFVSKVVF